MRSPVCSGRKRGAEIKARRRARRARLEVQPRRPRVRSTPPGAVPCNEGLLAPSNSYGAPDFVRRGYYLDRHFHCAGCGRDEIWTAAQQKWWYEVAQGYIYSTAKLCRPCRRREQAVRAEARRVHLEGIARKAARRNRSGR